MLFLTLAITYFASLWCMQGVNADSQCPTGHLCTPSLYQSPRFRWWWPGGWAEPDEVGVEITAIVDAGFGGAEIGDVEDSIAVQLDAEVYGWGQARWNSAVLRAYQKSNSLGAHVDLTLGPHWPTGFPGYTPDSPETSKELVHGQVFVQSGQEFSGSLPLPIAAPSGNTTGNPNVQATPFLTAVLVVRTTTTNESASIVNIDPSTVKLITSQVANGSLTWTAPSDGTYVLVAAYGRGTGQIQNMYDGNPDAPKVTYPFPAYIIDHLSPAGVTAGVKYWDQNILSPELLPLLNQSQGSIFEDSLELKLKQYWTMNFLQEFRQRRGYDLDPFLLYVIQDTNTFEGDSIVATQIQNDFYQTVSDLYMDYRLGGLKEWANSIGLKLRVQPYTATIDSAYAASVLDIPEGESLGFEGDNDAFRVLAAGRDIGGKTTILSDELGAYFGMAYGVTWKFILGTANLDMSLGVSQVVIHGFPYRDSPTSLWPGFAPFTPLGTNSNGFADAWGPRQPQWMYANNASLYLANAQKLLQDSGASIDIAILNQAWGVTATWDDTSLNDAGFSYQFPTPQLLSTYNAQVLNQRLAPSGPKYKALIINQTTIDVDTAQLLLSYGKSGLPIVISGPTPNTTFSYSPLQGESGAQIASILSQLTSLNSTHVVSDAAAVPAALQQLDVKPSIQYPQGLNNTLITYRRTVSTGYVYWIYNNGDSAVKETVQLEGQGWPMLINLWTGEVNAVASFIYEDGYTALNISLASTASVAIYLGPTNPYGIVTPQEHLVSTNCSSYIKSGKIYLSSNVSCTSTTSNGTAVSLSPDSLNSPVSPSNWTLAVQDWAPAVTNETGLNSSKTTKTELAPVQLTTLVSWPNITSLESAAGVGVYTTTISLTKEDPGIRVLFDVGSVQGTWGLILNGKSVYGIDQFNSEPLDITEYVVDGSNAVEITVATTLWNKLIAVWPAVYGSEEPQAIGLTGPVTFTYVKDMVV